MQHLRGRGRGQRVRGEGSVLWRARAGRWELGGEAGACQEQPREVLGVVQLGVRGRRHNTHAAHTVRVCGRTGMMMQPALASPVEPALTRPHQTRPCDGGCGAVLRALLSHSSNLLLDALTRGTHIEVGA